MLAKLPQAKKYYNSLQFAIKINFTSDVCDDVKTSQKLYMLT